MNPKDRIIAYLNSQRSSIAMSTVDNVVSDVKFNVFFGMSPLSDQEIRTIVVQWATIFAVGLLLTPDLTAPGATPAPKPAPSNSDLVDALNKAINVPHDVPVIGTKDANNVSLGVSGLTANLKSSSGKAQLGVSWTGALKLKAESGIFHFEGTVSDSSWKLQLSFPRDSYPPNMATLSQVFSKGLQAVGQIADATRSFNTLSDVSKVAGLIKPYVSSVEDAVDALQGIAETPRTGGISFGFKIGSPDPLPGQQGMPGGVVAEAVFTWVF